MHYSNSEMKLDQLVGYFRERKINLIPPFQRGHVWKLNARQRLIENIVRGRPIPAIFLYKQADGSKFTYNILDGKQRLESLLLFIGNARSDMRIETVKDYFFRAKEKRIINFPIKYDGKKRTFKQLSDQTVRDLREYAIPTIEIDLDDDGSLDEIINLFVDINQQGEKVKRFEIVKAIGRENALLKSALELIATQQQRKQDIHYARKSTVFSRVLQALQVVQGAADTDQKIDRMWERLVEIILFCRTGKHRAPGDILKSFIRGKDADDRAKATPAELKRMRAVFTFLDVAYKETDLGKTRLASDLPHFYTMVTSLLSSDVLKPDGEAPNYVGVRKKLLAFAKMLDAKELPAHLQEAMREYRQAAAKQTTHPGQRDLRQKRFLEILGKV